jgi:hypothetical protein
MGKREQSTILKTDDCSIHLELGHVAQTVADVFVCLGSDYVGGGRVSRRVGSGSFPADLSNNLAHRLLSSRRVISSRRFPRPGHRAARRALRRGARTAKARVRISAGPRSWWPAMAAPANQSIAHFMPTSLSELSPPRRESRGRPASRPEANGS